MFKLFKLFKRKSGPFDQKHYNIKYHHVKTGDDRELLLVCSTWREAVNRLLDLEKDMWIHIDRVDVKELT